MKYQNQNTIQESACKYHAEGCMNCLKRRYSLLEGLSYSELELLENNRYSIGYKAGETIYKAGTKPLGLLCLNEGKVKITKLGISGIEQIVGLKKPVEFIGFRTLIGSQVFQNSAIALEDTNICVIDKSDFFKVVGNNNKLAFRIFQVLAQENIDLEERMLNLTQKHLRARLADALILVEDIYGLSNQNELNVELKRADLAALSNMTSSNAIRVLSAFAKENILEINQRKIILKNKKVLKEISLHGR